MRGEPGVERGHDHKYDPISQREYYQLFAFFNTGVDAGLVNPDDPPPVLEVPTLAQRPIFAKLDTRMRAAEAALHQSLESETARLAQWEIAERARRPGPVRGSLAHDAAEAPTEGVKGPARYPRLIGPRRHEAGVVGQALLLDGPQHLEFSPDLPIRADQPWTIGFWVNPGAPSIGILRKRTDQRGLDMRWSRGRLEISLSDAPADNAVRVRSVPILQRAEWSHLVLAYDGTARAAGLRLFVDGRSVSLEVLQDALSGTAETTGSLDVGVSASGERFHGLLDELHVLPEAATAEEVRTWYWSERLVGVLRIAADQRDARQWDYTQRGFVEIAGTPRQRECLEQLDRARADLATLRAQIPRTLVMEESSPQRATHVLRRGAYDQPAERVQPGVPAVLPPLPPAAQPNRLTLARWLVQPDHPLTARVTVNRLWLQCFGEGLVETVGDFGSQGSLPSHPELLDWLARRFVDSGWNTKQLLRLIVTSATYRQSSVPTPEKLQRDPANRLLARGPRFRLSAEMLRDQSLAVSGLLVRKIGGPPVRPPQPPGIWEAVSYNSELSYEPDTGEGRWRRSLYSYWKRTAPPPSIQAFDSPTRETCTLRRPRTNTPLQALALLNDEAQVEAARVLAATVLSRAGLPASRLDALFARATGRGPSETERATLERLLERQLKRFTDHPSLARELNGIGEAPHGRTLPAAELAAWTLVAQTVLNLDEVITRR